MGVTTSVADLPATGRWLVDSAPIIYVLEDHPALAPVFASVFERAGAGDYEIVVSAITLAEVAIGPLQRGNEELAGRYVAALTRARRWTCVDTTADIAVRAARIRAETRLKLPDAIQVATALATGCDGLITHDRDFRALAESSQRLPVYGLV